MPLPHSRDTSWTSADSSCLGCHGAYTLPYSTNTSIGAYGSTRREHSLPRDVPELLNEHALRTLPGRLRGTCSGKSSRRLKLGTVARRSITHFEGVWAGRDLPLPAGDSPGVGQLVRLASQLSQTSSLRNLRADSDSGELCQPLDAPVSVLDCNCRTESRHAYSGLRSLHPSL